MFKLWSENNPQVKEILRPNLGVRSWDKLTKRDKEVVWCHFINKDWFVADEYAYRAVYSFDKDNKARAFCDHLLNHGGPHYHRYGVRDMEECCHEIASLDFKHIFHTEHQDVVYELFSYYVLALQQDTIDKEKVTRFKNLFNDIFNKGSFNESFIE